MNKIYLIYFFFFPLKNFLGSCSFWLTTGAANWYKKLGACALKLIMALPSWQRHSQRWWEAMKVRGAPLLSCNDLRTLNYISYGDASWQGKWWDLGPSLALWEQLWCLQCSIWRHSSYFWRDYVFWHIARQAARSISESEGSWHPPRFTRAAACSQRHTNRDCRRFPTPRTQACLPGMPITSRGCLSHLGADEATNGRLASLSLGQHYRTYVSPKTHHKY